MDIKDITNLIKNHKGDSIEMTASDSNRNYSSIDSLLTDIDEDTLELKKVYFTALNKDKKIIHFNITPVKKFNFKNHIKNLQPIEIFIYGLVVVWFGLLYNHFSG